MKNERVGTNTYLPGFSKIATVVPVANTLTACIELYEYLLKGEMPAAASVVAVDDSRFDVQVFPTTRRDRFLNRQRRGVLRVQGQPRQIDPTTKPTGIIAVLGAGNYSSSLEMVKALFLENCAVVHKPHTLNRSTDQIWAKIFQPLVDEAALSFVETDPERTLTGDARLATIYFTGGTKTAMTIMASTDTPLVSECGGNNPCIIVPGDRPWSRAELEHQANQIVTIAKFNGGAVCGRVQTLLTCRSWPQRDEFLDALRTAIVETVPPSVSYYPGSTETFAAFRDALPDGECLEPIASVDEDATFMLVTEAEPDGYAARHEAFAQILVEMPLDTPSDPATFVPAAVEVANNELLGTLACSIVVDDDTRSAHESTLQRAVTDLRYGAVAVNAMPPSIFLDPRLTWGGNEEDGPIVSGRGNFGNVLCFDNVEKSILIDPFTSTNHLINSDTCAFEAQAESLARYTVAPTTANLVRLTAHAAIDRVRRRLT